MKKTKLIIWTIIITLLVVWCSNFVINKINQNKSFGDWFATSDSLIGSSSNAVSLPRLKVFANNTTTAPSGEYGMADGGEVVTQLVDTNGKDKVLLNISAVGPTSTSTMYIQQMGSHDGTNYFDITTSTDLSLATKNATTTISTYPRMLSQWDPGVATNTISVPFDTYGFRNTRFIFWSEGWTGDLDVGVQAWIQAVPVETKH